MSAERPSLLDDDSDGYGEDSVRELTTRRPLRVSPKPYLSPKEISFRPGQVRKVVTEHSIYYPGQDTPLRRMSRVASQRLTPVKNRLHQCRALIRPLHSRYYPLFVSFYIVIAAVLFCYFFGATPAAVHETVLEPVVSTVGGAVTGMRDRVGDAYVGVRDSVGDLYSGAKERIEDMAIELAKRAIIEEKGRNETARGDEESQMEREKEKEKKVEEMVRKELTSIWTELGAVRERQEVYAEWSSRMNKKVAQMESSRDAADSTMGDRLESLEKAMNEMRAEMEDRMSSLRESTAAAAAAAASAAEEERPSLSLADYVTIEEFRMHMEDNKKELARLRASIVEGEEEEEWENLASYVNGATIIESATTFSLYSTLYNLFSQDRSPLFLLTERQLFPGDCMPLPATGGSVAIRLAHPGALSHIEYYHLHWNEASGIPFSAPKHIKITGCTDDAASVDCSLISECEYTEESTKERREEAKRRKIFGVPIQCNVQAESRSSVMRSMRFEVESNHGAEHTCLYLTRALGKAIEVE